MVLMAGPFPMKEARVGQPVEVVDRLAPPGAGRTLGFSRPDPRSSSYRFIESSPGLEGERVLFHRLGPARPYRRSEEEQGHEERQQEDGKLDRGVRRGIPRKLTPCPHDAQGGQPDVRRREEEEPAISGARPRRGRDGGVDDRDPHDQHRDKSSVSPTRGRE